jgi:zinc-ribbon domain
MQRCQFCGVELQENARFCGNCGRVQAAANQPGVSMPQGVPQAGSMPAANPGPSFSPPASSQAPSQQPQFPQPVPQNFAQPPQGSQFRPSPSQPQQAGQGQAPAQFQSPWPQQFQQPPMPQNPPQFPQQQGTASKASPGSNPRWLLIAIIGVIVIVVGGGALALLLHNSSASPNSGASANPTPRFTPVSSCVGNPSRTANLTFSGDVAGSMVINHFTACGPLTYQGQQAYSGMANGTISGTTYNFIFVALAYNGPGTYTFPKVVATLDKQGTQKTWGIDPTAGGDSITINSDGKSGTLNLHLFDPTNITSKVSVTGTWSS